MGEDGVAILIVKKAPGQAIIRRAYFDMTRKVKPEKRTNVLNICIYVTYHYTTLPDTLLEAFYTEAIQYTTRGPVIML